MRYCVSHTSRSPRGDERNGVDYHFVDESTFKEMIEAGAFVEWARVYDHYYGTAFSSLQDKRASGLDVLLDLDFQGAGNIRKAFQDAVLTYIMPPSLEVLERRLRMRATDLEEVVRARLATAREDMKNCTWYDYIIINDDLEKAIGEGQAVIISTRCRTPSRAARVKALFDISFP